MRIRINGASREIDVDPGVPLAWVIRDALGMTGTKVSCGMGVCGACTVHVDGKAERSCVLPVGDVEGKAVSTIEELAGRDHPVVKAWINHAVAQCGYCQPGFIMAVAALLAANPKPTQQDIDENLTNICRCGTYSRVRETVNSLIASQA